MILSEPFHEGELAVQRQAGEADNAVLNARMITSSIMVQALPFLGKQPWAILGALDDQERLWCSALVGEPGFVVPAPDGGELAFDLSRAPLHPANPLLPALVPGRALGALFIELATRRRLRVNGRVTERAADSLRIEVQESFPNCPKFIQKRAFEGLEAEPAPSGSARGGTDLGPEEQAFLSRADTFFLASLHPERGVDASHRGGRPGFIVVVDGSLIRIPDYKGNSLFQTFGNLAVDGRCGWVVPDFATGGLLHLTGRARVVWDDPDPDGRTAGTGRFLELRISGWHWTPPVLGAPRWTFLEASPLNP